MRFALNDVQWHLDAGLEDPAWTESFSSLDRVFELEGPRMSHGLLCHVIKWRAGSRDYYVKRYCPRGRHARKTLGPNRADVECRNYAYFARMGIPVPRVIAHGGQWKLGLWRRGAVVTEGVSLSTDLQTLANTRPEQFRDRAWLRHVMRLLAGYIRRLHEDGFTHRDLKWRNILVTAEEPPRVVFLDCPSGKHTSRFSLRHFIVRDLAMLDRSAKECLSRTMRLRFYLWYRDRTRLRPEDKELIAAVTALRLRRRRGASPRSLTPNQKGCDDSASR